MDSDDDEEPESERERAKLKTPESEQSKDSDDGKQEVPKTKTTGKLNFAAISKKPEFLSSLSENSGNATYIEVCWPFQNDGRFYWVGLFTRKAIWIHLIEFVKD